MNCKIISTGSKGNAVLIEDKILIDCGVPYFKIKDCKITLILLTHVHGDHFNKSSIKKYAYNHPNCRFACGEWLVSELVSCGVSKSKIDVCEPPGGYCYGDYIINPVELFHDVPNFGWKIMLPDGKRVFYATDTANLTGVTAKDYDLYLIEANYTDDDLNARIAEKQALGEFIYESRVINTHLSQEQADCFICENAGVNSEYIYLHQHEEVNNE